MLTSGRYCKDDLEVCNGFLEMFGIGKEEKLRSSQRIRNKSAKSGELKHRKPDFLYDFDSEDSVDRPRSASWSSSGGVAVVELRKKLRNSIKSTPKKSARKKEVAIR